MPSKIFGSGTLIRRLPEPESYKKDSHIFVPLISKWQSYIISKRGQISNCRFRNDSHISFRSDNYALFSAYVISEKITKFKKSRFFCRRHIKTKVISHIKMMNTAGANPCFLLPVCLSVGGTGFVNSVKHRRLAVY